MKTTTLPVLETSSLKTSEVLKFVNQMYDTLLNQYTLAALQEEIQYGRNPIEIFDQKVKLKVWRDQLLTSLPSGDLSIRIDIQVKSSNISIHEKV